jgi:hypothetical protein
MLHPPWTSELKKYVAEENQEWTTVLSKRSKNHQRSLENKYRGYLSGANRVPIGSQFSQLDNSLLGANHLSQIFKRISVFQMIKWPRFCENLHVNKLNSRSME